ncbi:MAG: hypothetical protein RIS92_492 [Verrucomicrobiota bacterium]
MCVEKDTDVAVVLFSEFADGRHDGSDPFVFCVTHVESEAVDSREEECFEHLGAVRGGPERDDDLGSPHG